MKVTTNYRSEKLKMADMFWGFVEIRLFSRSRPVFVCVPAPFWLL